uniref:Apple domain-containing protein n=1 Tax=Sander lucioperca TaxID=283035 RepID=A0A8C9Y226_SANLU
MAKSHILRKLPRPTVALMLQQVKGEPCLSTVYQNVDFTGADYRALFTADYEECQRACTQDTACQFFTLLDKAFTSFGNRFKCNLKFSWPVPRIPVVEKKTGVTSGFSQITQISQQSVCQSKLFPNTDIPGNNVEVIPAASPEHCQALCSAHSVCSYFSFNRYILTVLMWLNIWFSFSVTSVLCFMLFRHTFCKVSFLFFLCSNNFNCNLKKNNEELVTEAKDGITSGLPARFCQLDNTWLQVVYENVDFPTSDIRFELMDDADTCQRTCTQDAFCQFYTYANDNFNDPIYRYSILYACMHANLLKHKYCSCFK